MVLVPLSFFSPHGSHLVCTHYTNKVLCFLNTCRHIFIRDQSVPLPASPDTISPQTPLASWHRRLLSCQPGGSPPGSSRPSILITFQQTGQFVGPNPLQHKGHNGAYSGPLSSLDLLLPSGLPHFLIGGECLDRQILAAMYEWKPACVCASSTDSRARKHEQHTLGLSEDLSRRIVLSGECARGKILAVTPHAHWGTVMGAAWRGGWVFGCKFNQRGQFDNLITDQATWIGRNSNSPWTERLQKCAQRTFDAVKRWKH